MGGLTRLSGDGALPPHYRSHLPAAFLLRSFQLTSRRIVAIDGDVREV
jgi:hypothetical protein